MHRTLSISVSLAECEGCNDNASWRTPRKRLLQRSLSLHLRFAALAALHLCSLHSVQAFTILSQVHRASAPRNYNLCLGDADLRLIRVSGVLREAADGTAMQLRASKNSDEDLDCDNTSDDDGDDDKDDSDDDEDEVEIKPYGNRSLAWTKRYRRLNPYEKCRARVLRFGHRSKEDWDEAAASGQLGQYVPNRPDEMYAPEWVSWEEFLGLMRSYEDTRNLAVNILGLKSFDDYILFVRGNPKRAEGLRIPVRPDLFYKEEWVDEDTFFCRDNN